jgi:RHS repeat-associated protein
VNVRVSAAEAKLYYIHVDHLNTPRLVADDQQRTVWRWDQQEPFGASVPDRNPASLGGFEFPIRLPGQYFDEETNLAYNWHRNYDSGIGRFVESDPVGIFSGLNTYVYVDADPLRAIDPNGLVLIRRKLVPTLPNGNVKEGYTDQDNICSAPMGVLNLFQCTQQCCQSHDRCYTTYRCNAGSWTGNLHRESKACQICNSVAANCISVNLAMIMRTIGHGSCIPTHICDR